MGGKDLLMSLSSESREFEFSSGVRVGGGKVCRGRMEGRSCERSPGLCRAEVQNQAKLPGLKFHLVLMFLLQTLALGLAVSPGISSAGLWGALSAGF